MSTAATIIGCLLILPGAFIVATNWYCYIRWHLTQLRNPRRKCSDGTVRLLGGLMLSVGLVCLIAVSTFKQIWREYSVIFHGVALMRSEMPSMPAPTGCYANKACTHRPPQNCCVALILRSTENCCKITMLIPQLYPCGRHTEYRAPVRPAGSNNVTSFSPGGAVLGQSAYRL